MTCRSARPLGLGTDTPSRAVHTSNSPLFDSLESFENSPSSVGWFSWCGSPSGSYSESPRQTQLGSRSPLGAPSVTTGPFSTQLSARVDVLVGVRELQESTKDLSIHREDILQVEGLSAEICRSARRKHPDPQLGTPSPGAGIARNF